jgi:hypothetical protein
MGGGSSRVRARSLAFARDDNYFAGDDNYFAGDDNYFAGDDNYKDSG